MRWPANSRASAPPTRPRPPASSPKSPPTAARARSRSRSNRPAARPAAAGCGSRIVNDDMPFLVDSVANAIAARHLTIHRLLHPVVCVERDADGTLIAAEPKCDDRSRRESMMYIELDRADARARQELVERAPRRPRRRPRRGARLAASCSRRCAPTPTEIDDPEGAALLHWFADGAMTLLGYEVERPGKQPSRRARHLLDSRRRRPTRAAALGAMRYFENGGAVPLIAKAERKSTVHRRVPLDLVVAAAARERQDHRHRRPFGPVDQPGADRPGRGSAAAAPPPRGARRGVRLRPQGP